MEIPAPAVCDNCGTVFPSGIAFGPGTYNIHLVGNRSGPCPTCGGMGSVPDGIYDTMDDALRIVSTWSPDRISSMIESLERAKSAENPLAATQAVISQNRELWAIASRLLIPRDPAQFWAFVAALMAILMYLQSH